MLRRRQLPAAALALAVLPACAQQGAEGAREWSRRELGGFSLRLPAAARLQPQRGSDSRAGHLLLDEVLRIDYDLGPHADPLAPREGISERSEMPLRVQGLPGVLVSWRQAQPPRQFLGLHLPEVAGSTLGPIRLTLLAQTGDPAMLETARVILLSLRLSPAP